MDTPSSPAENLVIDAAGRIDQDIACIKCGYNLRGLDPNHICPECATPVGRSTRGDLLQFSDPDWIEKLTRGMNWIWVGTVLGIMQWGIPIALAIAMMAFRSSGSPNPIFAIILVMLPILMTIPGLVSMIGLWMATKPEPRRIFSERPTSVRTIARRAAILSFVYGLVHDPFKVYAPSFIVLFTVLVVAIGIVDTAAKLTYGRQLALRIPDLQLAKNARIVMCGLLATICLNAIFTLGMAGAIPSAVTSKGVAPSVGSVGTDLVSCFVLPANLIFGLWAIRLVDQFRKALRTSAQLARETWSRNLS